MKVTVAVFVVMLFLAGAGYAAAPNWNDAVLSLSLSEGQNDGDVVVTAEVRDSNGPDYSDNTWMYKADWWLSSTNFLNDPKWRTGLAVGDGVGVEFASSGGRRDALFFDEGDNDEIRQVRDQLTLWVRAKITNPTNTDYPGYSTYNIHHTLFGRRQYGEPEPPGPDRAFWAEIHARGDTSNAPFYTPFFLVPQATVFGELGSSETASDGRALDGLIDPIPVNTWFEYVCTYDSTDTVAGLKVYYRTDLSGTFTLADSAPAVGLLNETLIDDPVIGGAGTAIGVVGEESARFSMNGIVESLVLWDQVYTKAELDLISGAVPPAAEADTPSWGDCVSAWPIDEGIDSAGLIVRATQVNDIIGPDLSNNVGYTGDPKWITGLGVGDGIGIEFSGDVTQPDTFPPDAIHFGEGANQEIRNITGEVTLWARAKIYSFDNSQGAEAHGLLGRWRPALNAGDRTFMSRLYHVNNGGIHYLVPSAQVQGTSIDSSSIAQNPDVPPSLYTGTDDYHIPLNTWFEYAFTYDPNNPVNGLKVYFRTDLNGPFKPADFAPGVGPLNLSTLGVGSAMGAESDTNSVSAMNGVIESMAIWPKKFTKSELDQITGSPEFIAPAAIAMIALNGAGQPVITFAESGSYTILRSLDLSAGWTVIETSFIGIVYTDTTAGIENEPKVFYKAIKN